MINNWRKDMIEFRNLRKRIHISTRKTLRRRFTPMRLFKGDKAFTLHHSQSGDTKYYKGYAYVCFRAKKRKCVVVSNLVLRNRMREHHNVMADINRMIDTIIDPPTVLVTVWNMLDATSIPLVLPAPRGNPVHN